MTEPPFQPANMPTNRPDDPVAADAAMRHDVRNLLAPAMIALDRLSTHADQTVRDEAERGIAAIEAAVARLKRRS